MGFMTPDEKRNELAASLEKYKDLNESAILLRARAHRWAEELSEASRYLESWAERNPIAKTRAIDLIGNAEIRQLTSDLEVVNAELIRLEAVLDLLGVRPK